MKTRLRHPLRRTAADLSGKRPAVDDPPQSQQRAEPTEDDRLTEKEKVAAVAAALSFSRWRRLP